MMWCFIFSSLGSQARIVTASPLNLMKSLSTYAVERIVDVFNSVHDVYLTAIIQTIYSVCSTSLEISYVVEKHTDDVRQVIVLLLNNYAGV